MSDFVAVAASPPVRRRVARAVAAALAATALCVVCLGGAALLGGLSDDGPRDHAFGCGDGRPLDPYGVLPAIAGLTEANVRNAAVIIAVARELGVPPRGWVVGIATALQESRLTNLPHLGPRNDHDSIGLFQQRTSQGWGTVTQLADPTYQSHRFFEKLLRVTGWSALPLTVAAQRVQRSAYPSAYAKHEPLASRIVDALTGGASRAVGGQSTLLCAAAGQVAASGWTVPIRGRVTSGFRTAARPGHHGVDIAVAKGTPVRAATAGVVIVATCNAHVGGFEVSCDRDGSVGVKGCGWYVDLLHANRVITRYCHLVARPFAAVGRRVHAGEVIGRSGSSGNSSGPHLHFEVHINADPTRNGAVDPVPFMNQVGAPLITAVA